MIWPLQKTVWWFLKKFNKELTYDLVIPHQGIHPKELKTRYLDKSLYTNVHSSIHHNSRKVETNVHPNAHQWING